MRRSLRGHVDIASALWMWLIVGAIAAEYLYRHYTGNSLASLVNWWWAGGIGTGVVALIALIAFITYKRVRVEQVGGKTIVHFDGRQFEVLPEPPRVHRSTTGGAFGQPLREYITLKRGDEVLYEGLASDGERLLSALTERKPV